MNSSNPRHANLSLRFIRVQIQIWLLHRMHKQRRLRAVLRPRKHSFLHVITNSKIRNRLIIGGEVMTSMAYIMIVGLTPFFLCRFCSERIPNRPLARASSGLWPAAPISRIQCSYIPSCPSGTSPYTSVRFRPHVCTNHSHNRITGSEPRLLLKNPMCFLSLELKSSMDANKNSKSFGIWGGRCNTCTCLECFTLDMNAKWQFNPFWAEKHRRSLLQFPTSWMEKRVENSTVRSAFFGKRLYGFFILALSLASFLTLLASWRKNWPSAATAKLSAEIMPTWSQNKGKTINESWGINLGPKIEAKTF